MILRILPNRFLMVRVTRGPERYWEHLVPVYPWIRKRDAAPSWNILGRNGTYFPLRAWLPVIERYNHAEDDSPAELSETLWAEKLGLTVRQLRQWHALNQHPRMTVGEFKATLVADSGDKSDT